MSALMVTKEFLAIVFEEWERQYRENPESFQCEARRLLQDNPAGYGKACAEYFWAASLELSKRKRK